MARDPRRCLAPHHRGGLAVDLLLTVRVSCVVVVKRRSSSMRQRFSFVQFIKSYTPIGKTVSGMNLGITLRRQFKRLKAGIVLDVGAKASQYQKLIPSTIYMRLDIDAECHPDICCDVHAIAWESNYFDTIIATEVLEHLYDPQKAIDEMRRVLKPGGVCILSTRFIYPYHHSPKDYFRFTEDALQYLFRAFHQVEVYPHGGRSQVLLEIMGDWGTGYVGKCVRIFLTPLTLFIAYLPSRQSRYPCGFVVYAKK